ncbi:DUF4097 family beta strand repeat-containing protein [Nocardia wallacei]|uniref:DUF4097 family beta strand repeat-containing protein n=1 Tax=Nocardia wallacei TaxID=480035 RepID=UPI002453753F|nr:DUF4097 family beta strand repeat-containing protein [Nocardia wallacei]
MRREFDSPEPISVIVEAFVGHISVIAGDRTSTVVEVRADDQDRRLDVETVEQTRAEYSKGELRVSTPRPPSSEQPSSRAHGVIEIVIEVPTGSRVRADTEMGTIRTEGSLGDCRLTSSLGDIHIDTAGAVESTTSMGTTTVGTVTGELRARSANGDISIGTAESDVTATTAAGSIRVDRITQGRIRLETTMGELDIGVGSGTTAVLDLHTDFGWVRNDLDPAESPHYSDKAAEIQAHVTTGNIIVRRTS